MRKSLSERLNGWSSCHVEDFETCRSKMISKSPDTTTGQGAYIGGGGVLENIKDTLSRANSSDGVGQPLPHLPLPRESPSAVHAVLPNLATLRTRPAF